MFVINLFGSPGAGKSTLAAYVFSKLKMLGVNAELVTEFAKDKTWEKNNSALSNQAYLFGKQWFRMTKCQDDVDVIVTDSPLFLNILYNNSEILGYTFNQTVKNVFDSYTNLNYFLCRAKKYNPKGRNQTESESDALSIRLLELLSNYGVPFSKLPRTLESGDIIISEVVRKIKEDEA